MVLDLWSLEEEAERLHPTLEVLVRQDQERTFEAVDADEVSGVLKQLANEEALIRRGLDLAKRLEESFRTASLDGRREDVGRLRACADLWAGRGRAYVRCGARTVWRAKRVAYHAELATAATAKQAADKRARAHRVAAVRAAVERALQQRAEEERAAAEQVEQRAAEAAAAQRAAEVAAAQRAAEVATAQRAAEVATAQRAAEVAAGQSAAEAEVEQSAAEAATELSASEFAAEKNAAMREQAVSAAAQRSAVVTIMTIMTIMTVMTKLASDAVLVAADEREVRTASETTAAKLLDEQLADRWGPAGAAAKGEAADGDGRESLAVLWALRSDRQTPLGATGAGPKRGRVPRSSYADCQATMSGPGPPRLLTQSRLVLFCLGAVRGRTIFVKRRQCCAVRYRFIALGHLAERTAR